MNADLLEVATDSRRRTQIAKTLRLDSPDAPFLHGSFVTRHQQAVEKAVPVADRLSVLPLQIKVHRNRNFSHLSRSGGHRIFILNHRDE